MRLVRRLPDGYQRKREVDFVLDRLFETMTPMHFHLREVIFVTYNKVGYVLLSHFAVVVAANQKVCA